MNPLLLGLHYESVKTKFVMITRQITMANQPQHWVACIAGETTNFLL